jgi:hypothetical protein
MNSKNISCTGTEGNDDNACGQISSTLEEDFPELDFPAPPTGTLPLTKRQQRRRKDKGKKRVAKLTETHTDNAHRKEMLYKSLAAKRDLRTGATRRRTIKMAENANIDIRPKDDIQSLIRRLGIDPSYAQGLAKGVTSQQKEKMAAKVGSMDMTTLKLAMNMIKNKAAGEKQ